jgi:hypothetical protein
MKLRSLVLLGCMLLVPALAMFSHLIPPQVRAEVRRRFATATSGWLDQAATAVTESPEPARGSTASAGPLSQATVIPATTVTAGLMPMASGTVSAVPPPPAAAAGPAAGSPGVTPGGQVVPAPREPAPPPLVAQLADRTRQVRDQQARDQQAIETQLKDLGAVSFDCQPLPGPEGLHSSSCRVPVDATGQLQRVFQATGHDPGSASAALLEQVRAWRQRVAVQPVADAAAGGLDGGRSPPGDRFR